MEPLSNRKKVLEQKPMNFWERLYLPAIFQGMGITFRHMFKKKETIFYPEVEREFSENWRGMHSLKRDEQGRERCTACGLCALSCPAEAITMKAEERKPDEKHFSKGNQLIQERINTLNKQFETPVASLEILSSENGTIVRFVFSPKLYNIQA